MNKVIHNALVQDFIKYVSDPDGEVWDEYVRTHPDATAYHLFGWREIIHGAYGHATYYLMLIARDDEQRDIPPVPGVGWKRNSEKVLGVLPLVHLKHLVFGNDLVSLPFLDSGGILATNQEAEKRLLFESIKLARELRARRLELRHERLLACCTDPGCIGADGSQEPLMLSTRRDKVRMQLRLPESSEALLRSFRSKLRSQIGKPLKEGLIVRCGGAELLNDFYKVFLVNMRDLGSPVHSLRLMQRVVKEFGERCRIFVVYKTAQPVAASLVVGLGKVLRNPWASSLRKFASLSPNMLLYLRMLEFACDNGYRVFDFGRSTPGTGTYRFKEQWGAVPAPLFWHRISMDRESADAEGGGKTGFDMAARCWQKLPVAVTRIIGPGIRKYISL